MGVRGGYANGDPNYKLDLRTLYNAIGKDRDLKVNVAQSGMLVIKDLFQRDPYPATVAINAINSYLVHHSIWAYYNPQTNTEQIQTSQYAFSPTPAEALGTINKITNGPVHYTLTSTDNGVTTSTGDHSFNPTDGTFNNFITAVRKQCLKIKPSCTQNEVLQALGFGIDASGQPFLPTSSSAPVVKLGTTAYLYMNPTTGNMTCTTNLPYADTTLAPDGAASSQVAYNTGWMLVSGSAGGHSQTGVDQKYDSLINSSLDTNTPGSDDGYHLCMWESSMEAATGSATNGIQVQYEATFTPSSGYHNQVGEITIASQAKDVLNRGSIFFTNPN